MAVNASPTVPTESSTGVPAGGFSQWFRNIGDWLKSLSPAGATQYETDWANISLAAGFVPNGSAPQWRRIGKVFYFRGVVSPTSGNFPPNTTTIISNTIPGLGGLGPTEAVKTGWGPIAYGPVRLWIENAQIRLSPPPNVTNVNYVALSALSGVVAD